MSGPEPQYLTRAQVREVDRIAIEEYGIPSIILMENAARGAAEQIVSFLGKTDSSVAIVCGNGNNGGDGFAIARHLHNRGFRVVTFSGMPGTVSNDCRINRDIAQRMGIVDEPINNAESLLAGYDMVVDALVGTGLRANPSEQIVTLIRHLNSAGRPIVAVDIPSGLDCDTGQPLGEAVRARLTVTFVAPKIGFRNESAKAFTGEVVVADIGCPREIVARFGA